VFDGVDSARTENLLDNRAIAAAQRSAGGAGGPRVIHIKPLSEMPQSELPTQRGYGMYNSDRTARIYYSIGANAHGYQCGRE
jgi:hypothetical protein